MRTGRGLICGLGLAAAGLVVDAGVAQAQGHQRRRRHQSDLRADRCEHRCIDRRLLFRAGVFYRYDRLHFRHADVPGPASPEPLSYSFADIALEYGTSNSSFSALQSDFPTGDDTFDVTGGIEPTTIFTINYVGNTYALNPPELTAASLMALCRG